MLDNLKVGHKILASLLGVSLQSFVSLRASLDKVRREGMPNAIVAKDMQMQVVQIQQWLTDISATRGQDGLADGFEQAEKAHARFLEDLARIRASYVAEHNAQKLAQADQLATRMAEWYAVGQRMARAYIDQGTTAGNPINTTIAELVAHKDFSVQLSAEGRDAIAEVARSFNQLLGMLRGVLRELSRDAHRLDQTAEAARTLESLSAEIRQSIERFKA